MGSKVNYTLVGLFILILGGALVVAGFWITEGRHAKSYKTYAIVMKEAVSGLSEHAPVKFNGVEVGYVKQIQLDPRNPQQVLLLAHIEDDTPVTESTIATLRPQGITGLTYVALKATTATAPPLEPKEGEKYAVIPSTPSLFLQMDTMLRQVTSHIKEISSSLRSILDEENSRAIKNSLQNTEKFTDTLAKNSDEVDAIIKRLNRILHNASIASEELPIISKKLKRTLDSVNRMGNQVSEAGHDVSLTMRDGRVAIQTFSQQTMPSATEVLNRLKNVSTNLQGLTQDLRQNPSLLVRGRQPLPPGPGEHHAKQ